MMKINVKSGLMKIGFATAVLTFFNAEIISQPSRVLKGRVVDGGNNHFEPIVGAVVYDLEDIFTQAVTGIHGEFELGLKEKTRFLVINYGCSWMDIIIEIPKGKRDIVIKYGTKKSARETKKLVKRIKRLKVLPSGTT